MAYAIAELIDNSIQAGEGLDRPVNVEVICIDKAGYETASGRRRLDRIGVYDNASGMDAVTLRQAIQFWVGTHLDPGCQKGIGKFGMGLPNFVDLAVPPRGRLDVGEWEDIAHVP